MKIQTTITILAAGLCACFSLQAAILTVDNNPGAVAMYKTFQAAHDAASDGDTILISGSPLSYGTGSVKKRLNIVGPGYHLDWNPSIPGILRQSAKIGLEFRRDSTSSASGTRVQGFDLDIGGGGSPYVWGDLETGGSVPAGNIMIEKCEIRTTGTDNGLATRYTINKCLIHVLYLASPYWHMPPEGASGTIIRNSIVTGQIVVFGLTGVSVERCTFIGGQLSMSSPHSVSNSIFFNSIMHSPELPGPADVSYCLFFNPPLPPPSGINNIFLNGETEARSVFVGEFVNINNVSSEKDHFFLLKQGSPAIGAGANGSDLGAFSGADPYKLSGVPAIPRLTHLVVPPTATSESGLRFEVEAQAFGE